MPIKAKFYIPLWSYSNRKLRMEAIKLSLCFTFHYGPIQIGNLARYEYTERGFTFHYGPIQIMTDVTVLHDEFFLHSTMVLFKSVAIAIQ